jgi:hypothetical protein
MIGWRRRSRWARSTFLIRAASLSARIRLSRVSSSRWACPIASILTDRYPADPGTITEKARRSVNMNDVCLDMPIAAPPRDTLL